MVLDATVAKPLLIEEALYDERRYWLVVFTAVATKPVMQRRRGLDQNMIEGLCDTLFSNRGVMR